MPVLTLQIVPHSKCLQMIMYSNVRFWAELLFIWDTDLGHLVKEWKLLFQNINILSRKMILYEKVNTFILELNNSQNALKLSEWNKIWDNAAFTEDLY